MRFKAVLFDVIGTTVKEKDPKTIMNCFERAFHDHDIKYDSVLMQSHRGKDKNEMIELVLLKNGVAKESGPKIYNSFVKHVEKNLDNFIINDGADEIIDYLKSQNVKIGLGTALSQDLFKKIMGHLKWPLSQFDYIGIASNVGRPRPHPDMIIDMMKKMNVDNLSFLKVGDTVTDILEGKNANVATAAILSGTQPREELQKANPDFMISKLGDLAKIIQGT